MLLANATAALELAIGDVIGSNTSQQSPPSNSTYVAYDDDVISSHMLIAEALNRYCRPSVILIGVVGNVVTVVATLRLSRLRHYAVGHLLAAISVSDTLFLVSSLPMWVTDEFGRLSKKYDLYNKNGWCEFLTLSTMSSSFLSTWFTVALAVERYASVWFRSRQSRQTVSKSGFTASRLSRDSPTTESDVMAQTSLPSVPEVAFCGPFAARIAIIAVAIFAVCVFVNISVNIGVVDQGGTARCLPLPVAFEAFQVLNNLDLLFNVALPYLIIVALYAITGTRLVLNSYRGKYTAVCRDDGSSPVTFSSSVQPLSQPEVRLTKMAAFLSATVIILQSPSQTSRAYHMTRAWLQLTLSYTVSDYLIAQLVLLLFHASFAVPFFIVMTSYAAMRTYLPVFAPGNSNRRQQLREA